MKYKTKNTVTILMIVLIVVSIVLISKYSNSDKKGFFECIKEYATSSFSDILPKGNESEASEVQLEAVTLIRVIDGDTILVKNSSAAELRIRMIGVDTPESVNPDENKNTEEGRAASKYTKSMLKEGSVYYLEYDEEKTDKYGRTLAYVWLRSDVTNNKDKEYIKENMYNAILLANGYATTLKIPPNTKYSSVFNQIEKDAKINKTNTILSGSIEYVFCLTNIAIYDKILT